MNCVNYEHDVDQIEIMEKAHYHFTLSEIVYYIQQYGLDPVMTDVYDLLASEGNAKIKQLEMLYEEQ